jgi:hypothetical protein
MGAAKVETKGKAAKAELKAKAAEVKRRKGVVKAASVPVP